MELSLRKAKPTSRGNVQNRKWKMSTSSSMQTSKRKPAVSFRLLAVTGFQVSLCLSLCLSHCVSLNNISFLITSNQKHILHLSLWNKCWWNRKTECDTHNNEEFLHMPVKFLALKKMEGSFKKPCRIRKIRRRGIPPTQSSSPPQRSPKACWRHRFMNGCKLGWFRIPHRLRYGVCCEKEREGPEQSWPIGFRQSWPAFFQKESAHRINRAHQSGVCHCLRTDWQREERGRGW